MGRKAKLRAARKLSPNQGNLQKPPYTPTITVIESTISRNFLIMVDGVCFDSTASWGEAMAIKLWLEEEHHERPLKRGEGVLGWVLRSKRQYPETTAEILQFDPATKQFKKGTLTL